MSEDKKPRAADLCGGTIEAHGERGLWVPEGMTAAEIMAGAAALEERFEVDHYTARSMVRTVLEAVRRQCP